MNYAYNGPGKPPRKMATTQDSLDLYNNYNQLMNFYRKNKYKIEDASDGLKLINIFNALDDANKEYNATPNKYLVTPQGTKSRKEVQFRKNLDENRFLQRESANAILNTNAPMALFDRRITPKKLYLAESTTDRDKAEIVGYDPLQVKPVKMLTPQERAERERRYGKISQTNPKQQQVLQIAKKIVPPPVQRTVHAPIDFLEPKQAQMLARLNNLEQPMQLRTMPVPVRPNTSMAQSLRYPAQAGFAEKLMRKFQGKPNIPYWMDEYGNERYPKYGENTAEQVREMRRLTSDLDPQTEEGAKELARIEMLRMMSPESRKVVMSGGTLAEK